MPVFVRCELEVGVQRSGNPAKDSGHLEALCEFVEQVYPEPGFAHVYSQIVARLLAAGKPIPVVDALIATVAIQNDEALVTRDTSHFRLVEGLVVLSHHN